MQQINTPAIKSVTGKRKAGNISTATWKSDFLNGEKLLLTNKTEQQEMNKEKKRFKNL